MAMKVIQTLWFETDMEAALQFYASLIPGSKVEPSDATPTDSPSGPAGSVKVANFTLGDQRYMAMEAAGRPEPMSLAFAVMVECDDQPEIDRLWDALGEGGTYQACGWLRDRWGLSWQITPRFLNEMMSNPDRAKGKRVADAMMKMVKLDIAELEAAAAA